MTEERNSELDARMKENIQYEQEREKNKEQNLRVICDNKSSNICVNRLPEERRKMWC